MIGGSGGGWSGEDFSYHSAVHVRESEVATLEAIGELLMVEAEKVEEGGVQVVDVDLAFDDSESEFVRGSVNVAAVSGPRQPSTS